MTEPRKERHTGGAEIRDFQATGLEVRSGAKGSDVIEISGYPIIYDEPYSVADNSGLPPFIEVMEPGVVAHLIGKTDTRFLFNHGGLPLARTTSGTLQLRDSATKLGMTAQLDARQQTAQDLAIAIERGDVNQMSVGMIVSADTWDKAQMHRQVRSLSELLDISAVTYPASPTTSIALAQRAQYLEQFARTLRPTDDLARELAELRFEGVRRDLAQMQRAKLSSAEKDSLPDESFAHIEPGGTLDASGRTIPRKLRHFPIHDKGHVVSALARAPQSPFGSKAMPAIIAAAKSFGIIH